MSVPTGRKTNVKGCCCDGSLFYSVLLQQQEKNNALNLKKGGGDEKKKNQSSRRTRTGKNNNEEEEKNQNKKNYWDAMKPHCDAVQYKVLKKMGELEECKVGWNYLQQHGLKLAIIPGLQIGGRERYGGYDPNHNIFFINPTKMEHIDNPLELADTWLHEVYIHALLNIPPLSDIDHPYYNNHMKELYPHQLHDRESDRILNNFVGCHQQNLLKKNQFHSGLERTYMEHYYGSAIAAESQDEYTDININCQNYIKQLLIKIKEQLPELDLILPSRYLTI
jgi:hypothetical protein